jgi:hypothetical protein
MYDIYGQPLKEGHCEVHPVVGVPFPCPLCQVERAQERVILEPEETWTGEPNPRIEEYEGQLDDFLASDVQAVHFEATDQSQWCATITMRDGGVWQLTFGAKNPNAKGHAHAEQVE